ncbi:MAG: hypothetical protein U9O56_02735 [Campylobacterota bacterium]|nr:hypothetical protein [Campylobacterota bacterium]
MQDKIKIFLLLIIGLSLHAQYISVDKYISSHPNEGLVMDRFVSLINKKAEPLLKKYKNSYALSIFTSF